MRIDCFQIDTISIRICVFEAKQIYTFLTYHFNPRPVAFRTAKTGVLAVVPVLAVVSAKGLRNYICNDCISMKGIT